LTQTQFSVLLTGSGFSAKGTILLVEEDIYTPAVVAEWLRAHPPQGAFTKVKEPVHFDGNAPSFEIDLVLYDTASAEALCVMDTKYKEASVPSPDDFAQVVAYAKAKGCHEAVLVYPSALSKPLDAGVGGIRVRSLVFSLDGDLDEGGRAFVQYVL
jgi:5-methylcytosine-specific restriction enzyme subunit McrC